MSEDIRVIRTREVTEWEEISTPPGDENPPGEEYVAFRSPDGLFVTGEWRRDPERGTFEREYDEIAYIVEGEVEVTTDDGRVLKVGSGDILITPKGTSGVWDAKTPVRKFWAIYKR